MKEYELSKLSNILRSKNVNWYWPDKSSIRNIIKIIKPIYTTSVDKYIIYFEGNVARIDGEEVNSIEVITIPHTKNILTMYPIKTIGKTEVKKFTKALK